MQEATKLHVVKAFHGPPCGKSHEAMVLYVKEYKKTTIKELHGPPSEKSQGLWE